jgi:heparanase
VYAQCLRDRAGGVGVLAINTSDAERALEMRSPAEIYALTAPSLTSGTVLLNGQPLSMGPGDAIPELHPHRVQDSPLTVAPQSIDFIAFPHARNPNCK